MKRSNAASGALLAALMGALTGVGTVVCLMLGPSSHAARQASAAELQDAPAIPKPTPAPTPRRTTVSSPFGQFVMTEGAAHQIPASNVEILRTFLFVDPTERLSPEFQCVFFVNHASRVATNIDFVFSTVTTEGKQLLDAPLDVQGTFSPGVRIATMPSNVKTPIDSCLAADPTITVASTTITVTGVRYADGSIWHAFPTISGTDIGDVASGARITSIAAYSGVLPVEVGKGIHGFSQPTECVDVVNISGRQIKDVHVTFRHSGEDASNLSEDHLDLGRGIAPGATATNNCVFFAGSTQPSALRYAQALWEGKADTTMPTIMIKGKPSTLAAFVDEIDFADGKVWQAPPLTQFAPASAGFSFGFTVLGKEAGGNHGIP